MAATRGKSGIDGHARGSRDAELEQAAEKLHGRPEPLAGPAEAASRALHLGQVAVIGGGTWGTAIACQCAQAIVAAGSGSRFSPTVRLWVCDEVVNGQLLSTAINRHHSNPKYLPGVRLPSNLIAIGDLADAARGACWVLKGHADTVHMPTPYISISSDSETPAS